MMSEMNPAMKMAYSKGLRELIAKMRSMEARHDNPEEAGESPMHEAAEKEGVSEFLEPMMDDKQMGDKLKPGVMAQKGKSIGHMDESPDDGSDGGDGSEDDDLESAKKDFFKRPASAPVKGKTRAVIMSMTMKSPLKTSIKPGFKKA